MTSRQPLLRAVKDDRLISDDETDFEAFYRRHRPALSAAFHRLTDDSRYVEDAVQEGLLIARRRWQHIKAYDYPEAWVAKVTLRLLLRWQHHDRRHQQRVATTHDPPPSDNSHACGEHDDVVRAVAALPPRQREVVVLHYFLDLPIQGVADVLGRAEGTVKAQLFTARETLRAALGEEESSDAR